MGGAGKEGNRALNGFRIGLRDTWFESFRGDTVDGSGTGLVVIVMTSNPRIKPVGDVECSVGSDHYVRRTEEVTSLTLDEIETIE